MEVDRQKLLEQIILELGMIEREDDEFTSKELTTGFSINSTNLIQYLEINEIGYTRRKAIADGRRQYVYKLIKEAL